MKSGTIESHKSRKVRLTYLPHPITELFYRYKLTNNSWQGRQDLNLRPSVLETDALPTELLPYVLPYCM
jgi:hypothetical protein